MERVIDSVFEAENNAKKLVDKAKLDRDWSSEVIKKQIDQIKEKHYAEAKAAIERAAAETDAETAKQIEKLKNSHEEKLNTLKSRFDKEKAALCDRLFAELTKI